MQVVISSTGGTTDSGLVNGTIGGAATTGIPANSQVAATCTISTAQLAQYTQGSAINGSFEVKLVNSSYPFPAGTETYFSFDGTWSTS